MNVESFYISHSQIIEGFHGKRVLEISGYNWALPKQLQISFAVVCLGVLNSVMSFARFCFIFDITYARKSVSPAASVCQMQNKGHVLFCWTMKPTKHFKTFLSFHIQQIDIFCINYILKTKQNIAKKKKDSTLFDRPKQTSMRHLELQCSILAKNL